MGPSRLALLTLATAFAPVAGAQSLTTTVATDNAWDGSLFDLQAKVDLTVTAFDVNFGDSFSPASPCATACPVVEVEVHETISGGYFFNAGNFASWIQVGAVQHTVTTGYGALQPLHLALDVDLVAGESRGFYVTNTGPINSLTGLPNQNIRYVTQGPDEVYENHHLRIPSGSGAGYPFVGYTFATPRDWSGTVYYNLPGCERNPQSYCTPGTSALGCAASLSAVGRASATKGTGFFVYASGVEAGKPGLYFFGQNGRQANPWGNGSSLQCVAPPVRRAGVFPGGGADGFCNGTFGQDLNALWCSTCPKPALEPTPGLRLQVQLWYRDPQSTSNVTTSLSNAIEVDICP